MTEDDGISPGIRAGPDIPEHSVGIRLAVCGAGVLGGIVIIMAHLPLVLLAVPVTIFFLGFVANPEEVYTAWYGTLNTLGIFDPAVLGHEEQEACTANRRYFWFGEVASAAALAGMITVPLGKSLAGWTGNMLSFAIAAMLFLLLFVFLPKLIRQGTMADTETIVQLFGKNEQIRKVFWSVFIILAGLVLAQIVDPATAQQIIGILTGLTV